ncbi:MAG: hypothetical protein HZA53_15955 [Planctomycetes bacterium]|nr:hypothetical protein [Planctomycetota bacterium]
MRSIEIVRAAAGSALAFFLLGSGSCEVGLHYCSEDCDPCVSVCHCDQVCVHALAADHAGAFEMQVFALTIDRQPDGRWTRTYSGFAGLSLDRAFGPGEHDARAIERFARNVIEANRASFGRESEWSLAGMERANGGLVATFGSTVDTEAALEFLFDREGALLAVARHGAS